MGLRKTHYKISAGCVILIMICTPGFHIVVANAAEATNASTTTSTTSTTTTSTTAASALAEKIADSTEESEKNHEILENAETKDGKAEIIKHIQRVNNDGTYTVGYEADDGTFKIESRDVLGNVKGTFGYVDANGEIKRVSYTANNGTGLKNSQQTSSEEIRENPKFNRTLLNSTTRRPPYSSSIASPTASSRGTVIQTIPRRLRISSSTERPYRDYSSGPSISASSAAKLKGGDPSSTIGTVVYATSVPTSKPYINIRPTPLPGTNIRHQSSEQQISRPEKLEIDHVSQVQISSNRETSTSKPVTEEVDERDEDKLILRGSTLRRQLSQDPDGGHLYGPSSSGSIRNLPASLTSGQKIPALVLAARQRASQIQSSINSYALQNEKSYSKVSDRKSQNASQEPTPQTTSEHTYLTQSPVQDQIPANKLHQNPEQENRVLRKSEHRSPQFVRIHPSQNGRPNVPQHVRIPLPQSDGDNEQYLRETTSPQSRPEALAEQDPIAVQVPQNLYYRRPQEPSPQDFYYQPSPPPQQLQRQQQRPTQLPPQQAQPQDQMTGFYPQASPAPPPFYRGQPGPGIGGPYPYYNDYAERPLTTRDFERLLQLLILRHQYLQRVSSPYGPYDPYGGYGAYQFQRPPIAPPVFSPYDNRFPYRGGPIPPYLDQENMYQAQNPIPQTEGNAPSNYELQRLMPRKKQYTPRYFGLQNNQVEDYGQPTQNAPAGDRSYLPADVREELLYRMLMLALQAEQSAPSPVTTAVSNTLTDVETPSTTAKTISPHPSYRKPVRSVQILGEEN